MGAEGILIAFAIILVIVVFYGNQLSEWYTTFANSAIQTASAKNISITPQNGGTACTLKINFHTTLQGSILFPSNNLVINNGAQYSWIGCHKYGSLTFQSLIPTVPNAFLGKKLAFFDTFGAIPSDLQFDGALVADDGTQLTSLLRPELHIVKHVADVWAVKDNSFDLTFVLTNIPAKHFVFNLSSSNYGINGNSPGQPYQQNITPPSGS